MRPHAYLFDLDGTLYLGGEAIPGAAEVLQEFRSRGAAIRFLTNNSGTTPAQTAAKLAGMGFDASPDEVLTSGMAAADYAGKQGHRNLFVIGEPGLVSVLRERGFEVVNADRDGSVFPLEPAGADAVVCGICRHFTYSLLNAGLQAILGGAGFVATNPDATYPMEGGRLEPGAGSLVAGLRTCTGVEPYVAGKPSPDMVRLALESCGVSAADGLMVGDRVDTDISAGEAAGCPSVLVLTGVTIEAPPGLRSIATLAELL